MDKIEDINSISFASALFIVKNKGPNGEWKDLYPFGEWMIEHGFTRIYKVMAASGVPYYWVNMKNKKYTPGKGGCGFGHPVYEHAITPEEFKTIYEIFDKYNGKQVLDMEE